MDRVLGDPWVIFDECVDISGDCDECAMLRDPFIHCVGEREVGGANMRACSRIPLFKINSAGVTPVEVFSTVFIIRCTMGSCSYDHLHSRDSASGIRW